MPRTDGELRFGKKKIKKDDAFILKAIVQLRTYEFWRCFDDANTMKVKTVLSEKFLQKLEKTKR